MTKMKCKYDTNNNCELLRQFNIHCSTLGTFCDRKCGIAKPNKQYTLLLNLGIVFKEPWRNNGDLIEWIKEQIEKGNITKQHPGPCPGCGTTKNIIEGFGRLGFERICGRKPEKYVVERAAECAKCEHRTFLPVTEWAIESSIGYVKQKLLGMKKKSLPINHDPGPWTAIWCADCGCYIEAAIRAKKKSCTLGKWKEVAT